MAYIHHYWLKDFPDHCRDRLIQDPLIKKVQNGPSSRGFYSGLITDDRHNLHDMSLDFQKSNPISDAVGVSIRDDHPEFIWFVMMTKTHQSV